MPSARRMVQSVTFVETVIYSSTASSMFHVNVAVRDGEGGPKWWREVKRHLNFYRIHVMYYTFTPLIFSAIFYGCNGRYPYAYIDSLYACVSAMTLCGLITINLSGATGWQQAILFILMSLGSPVVVAWATVLLRRHYFAIKFEHVLKADAEKKAAEAVADPERRDSQWPLRASSFLRRRRPGDAEGDKGRGGEKHIGEPQQLRPDNIRKMGNEPRYINPSTFGVPFKKAANADGGQSDHLSSPASAFNHEPERLKTRRSSMEHDERHHVRRLSEPGKHLSPASPQEARLPRSYTMQAKSASGSPPPPEFQKSFTRTQTVGFAHDAPRRRGRSPREHVRDDVLEKEHSRPHPAHAETDRSRRSGSRRSRLGSLSRQPSSTDPASSSGRSQVSEDYRYRGFGGFPMPIDLISHLFSRLFPNLKRRLQRSVSVPATTSLVSQRDEAPKGSKSAPYISFNATVGRNSAFYRLSQREREELGGVEYRALNALLWIVGLYHVITQLIGFVIVAPYISTPRWHQNFVPPAEQRRVSPAWFSIFQCVSAYANCGLSLVDQSMLPFQTAYVMIFVLAFLIFAGNTAFPVFLRFTIWVLSKLIPKTSAFNETLHFLLDHPRRSFILLFPPHQTWFLLSLVCGLTFIGWFFFMVLDIGNPGTEYIPLGTRFVVGFFQNVAVRTAGFAAVSMSGLAAAVKFLFVILMYISPYPLAMSIRSTNVYEEQSLGIFPSQKDIIEDEFEASGSGMKIWGRYLAMHARRQLAFDMWWLAAAVFIVCIYERHHLDDPSFSSWFNIFTVIFEVVSAYGTVGLSLGTPNNYFSFSGELRSLSKFVLCLVMLRGRHRSLPVAIDRAVMLPSELQSQLDQNADASSRDSHMSDSDSRSAESGSHRSTSNRSSQSPRTPEITSENQDEGGRF
ncbi:putative cation transport protein [Lyophyllum shimeji]|uniref:Potassium transport protein n=1 Tax=Lyophyllum shimeji TaxID=47721 RepID=A0A9P3UQ36_LYOSH|nr:putative cation transport protein [Lyophyllum shimeji]